MNPARITEWDYPENRASPQNIVVDNTVAKSWTRDGLDRPVVATDFNVSDGTPTFDASRPTLVTTLSYDTMGRTLVDQTNGTFPSSSPTLGGVTNTLLSRATWTRSATFRGPSSITTVKGEKIEWTYSTITATLNEIERTGVANTRTITASLQSEGGQWTRATIGGITIAKERDAFGFVTSSSVTTSSDETVFEETLLRGPTGRITADRRKGVLFSDRARSYKYDALQRLTEFKVDTNTAMSREAFVAQVNAALSDEDAGYNVLTSVDATVTLSSTKADVLTNATVDHEGRGYTALDDPDAAGVPLEQVNAQLIDRDERDRVKDDGALEYTWDVFDRLVLVTRDGTEELRIAYDGVGRRRLERRLVTMPTSGTTTEDAVLEYAGANVIEEYAAEGPATFLTVTHAPGIDAPLIAAAGPTAAATTHTWALGTNARGDASSAINLDTEAVNEEAILDAWGEREVVGLSNTVCVEGGEANGSSLPDGGCADESRALQRFGLAGARLHARTKLVDMRNRVYATHTRSFLTKDPLGNIDSEGLWNYVAGDPINFRDPWGLAIPDGKVNAQGCTPYKGSESGSDDSEFCDSTKASRLAAELNRLIPSHEEPAKQPSLGERFSNMLDTIADAGQSLLDAADGVLAALRVKKAAQTAGDFVEDVVEVAGDAAVAEVGTELAGAGGVERIDVRGTGGRGVAAAGRAANTGTQLIVTGAAVGVVLGTGRTIVEVGGVAAQHTRRVRVFAESPTASARALRGADFEKHVRARIGASGNFKERGREFDGKVGNTWIEAKSGAAMPEGKILDKLKSDLGDHAKIARDNNASLELHVNYTLSDTMKTWLSSKNIGWVEHL